MTVEGIGELRPHGTFWILTYTACGHEQWFMRNEWNYDDAHVTAQVRTYYAGCDTCARHVKVRRPG